MAVGSLMLLLRPCQCIYTSFRPMACTLQAHLMQAMSVGGVLDLNVFHNARWAADMQAIHLLRSLFGAIQFWLCDEQKA